MFDDLFPILKDNEMPAPRLWNNVAYMLRGIQSRSEPYLMLNARPGGGLYIDLNIDAIRSSLASDLSLWLMIDEETATWSLSGGSIRIAPSTVVTVSAVSNQAATDGLCIWIEWNDSTATVHTGGSFPHLVNMTNKVCRTPLGQISVTDGVLKLSRLHPGGDICVYDRPWILVNGYANGTKAYRTASTSGEEQYVTPSKCPTKDASDSGSDSESNGGV